MIFHTFRAWRRRAAWFQAAVLIGLPFIRVSGESALRFDVPSLKLYFFGSVVWIGEAYFYLILFLLFFVAIMLITVLYGRVWCGWVCPQTVLSDLSRQIQKAADRISVHPIARGLLSLAFLLLFSVLVAANLVWYFIPPADMLRDAIALTLGPWTLGSWMIFSLLIYLNLAFVRHRFCGAVCPYARLQSSFFDQGSLTIGFDRERADECLECGACERNCPAGIDIRKGPQVECINCAECIDVCESIRKKIGKDALVGYRFGDRSGRRPRVIGLSALISILIVLFAYQVHIRVPVEFWVLRDDSQSFHQIAVREHMMNTFDLLIENRSLEPAEYVLTVTGAKDLDLVIPKNPVLMPPNSVLKIKVYLLAERKNLSQRITRVRFTLENTARHEIRLVRESAFIYSDRSDRGVEI